MAQQDDAQAEKNAQNRADRRVLGKPRTIPNPLYCQDTQCTGCCRARHQQGQITPVAAERYTDEESERDSGQGGVADCVGYQRAFAQKRKHPNHPGADS